MTHEAYFKNLLAALRGGDFHDFVLHVEDEKFLGRQIGDEKIIEQVLATDEPTLLTMTHRSGGTANIRIVLDGPQDRIADMGTSDECLMDHLEALIEGVTE